MAGEIATATLARRCIDLPWRALLAELPEHLAALREELGAHTVAFERTGHPDEAISAEATLRDGGRAEDRAVDVVQSTAIVHRGETLGLLTVGWTAADGGVRAAGDESTLAVVLSWAASSLAAALARERVERPWDEDREELSILAANSTELIARIGLDGTCRYASPSFGSVLGDAPPVAAPLEIIHPDDREAVLRATRRLGRGGLESTTVVARVHRRDDGYLTFAFTLRAVCDERNELQYVDVSGREDHGQPQHEALRDRSTGAASRELLLDHIRDAAARRRRTSEQFSVVAVGVALPSHANDAAGEGGAANVAAHGVDEQVRTIAVRRARRVVREMDTVAWVDDLLVLLLAGVSPAQALDVARRTVLVLAEPILLPGGSTRVETAAGVAHVEGRLVDGDLLLRRARAAMEQARTMGGATVVDSGER